MSKKINWIIHYCANGAVCADCGKMETGYLPYTCNAHTHGLAQYGHKDFQIVLDMPVEYIGYILNALGRCVQDGDRFCVGELVRFPNGLVVKLAEFEECDRTVLRVLIPDKKGRFPDQPGCMKLFALQMRKTDDLHYGGIHIGCSGN